MDGNKARAALFYPPIIGRPISREERTSASIMQAIAAPSEHIIVSVVVAQLISITRPVINRQQRTDLGRISVSPPTTSRSLPNKAACKSTDKSLLAATTGSVCMTIALSIAPSRQCGPSRRPTQRQGPDSGRVRHDDRRERSCSVVIAEQGNLSDNHQHSQ